MRRIELHYQIAHGTERVQGLHNPMMALLFAVRTEGSISAAAKRVGYSYRHVWGQLKAWEAELGQALIVWERGQAATLTPFADKLIWTERLAQARLAPQIETLQAELERTLALAFDDNSHVLGLYASHDDALPLLQSHASQAGLHLDIHFCGSVDAIRALNEGRCVVAGFHTRDMPLANSPSARAYQPLLTPGRHKLIGFAERTQGLVVAKGNPRRVQNLRDVARWQLRFANRALGSGTRLLLDELLDEAALSASDITGYDRVETSHAAVAQAVAGGSADVGLATESAAHKRGLGFIPLLREHYHLACLNTALEQSGVKALRETLSSPGWQTALGLVPGYTPDACGKVRSLKATLPWWVFKKPLFPLPDKPG